MAEPEHKVITREINWNAEVRKIYGPHWNAPEVEYRFSNGKEFKRKTEDAGIYETSPDF